MYTLMERDHREKRERRERGRVHTHMHVYIDVCVCVWIQTRSRTYARAYATHHTLLYTERERRHPVHIDSHRDRG